MVHLKTLGIKAIAIGITVFSLFGIFYNANLTNLFWVSVLATGITYLIGDLFVLRRFGNVTASIADFPLSFLSIWLLCGIFIEASIPIITTSLMAAFFIACCEPFIHTYMVENLEDEKFEEQRERSAETGRLQTEFSEEFDSNVREDQEKDRDK
ncbi:YndM family protein [Lentibacillus sp. CBA3610]|uniref:YndM family protein n=1 Tax=Lentibacillus sp. CBA3610 TaxID=2518176 RepID=UPI0015954401|nr:YndM family protein [Lentibacillus sp. CBA3610]